MASFGAVASAGDVAVSSLADSSVSSAGAVPCESVILVRRVFLSGYR